MRKRLLIGLLSAGLVGAMLPGVVAAETCQPFDPAAGSPDEETGCYYATRQILAGDAIDVNEGVTINGTPEDDWVRFVKAGGTFNGGRGDDSVFEVRPGGTFNGGRGNDSVQVGDMDGTFNGGRGDDYASDVGALSTFNGGRGNDAANSNNGTFNGGRGDDYVGTNYGTFNGDSGSDCYDRSVAGTESSAAQGTWTVADGCTIS